MGRVSIILSVIAVTLVTALAFWLFDSDQKMIPLPPEAFNIPQSTNQPITPLPQSVETDGAIATLGGKLFRDKRFSRDNTMSCSSCHILELAGQDNHAISLGVDGKQGVINSPSVFNSRYNFRQFWDGRAATLEDQVEGPIHNPLELDSNWNQVLEKLELDLELKSEFLAIWKDGITKENIQFAIAEFERSLITPNAPFDRHLRGERDSLSQEELEGWHLFRDFGCIACHQGRNIGGNMYAKMGVIKDYFNEERTPIRERDLGRYNVTKNIEDKFVFKVPSLRNVEETAPYFHDGSIETLENAVEIMAEYQAGVILSSSEKQRLVAFLKSLTGEPVRPPL